ncbi:MAG: glycosyltransferase family 39 protein [Labilithrix sp.]|nr:glycosyltransferase family 39 protein [Labilithrix sp.]
MTAEAEPSTTQRRAFSDGPTSSPSPSDERGDAKIEREATPALVALAIFVVAFTLRFLAARLLAGEPVWDGHYYDFGARRIAEGHGYSDDRLVGGRLEWHPWCHYPVGYSGYLAFFYWLFGAHGWVAHLANGVTGALACVIVYLLGREALSERRARLAGALATLHPGLILYGALVMGELLSALTVMTAFWVAIRGSRGPAPWLRGIRGVAAGALVLGAGALVRPQALLCAPFLALAIVSDAPASRSPTSREAWRERARRWAPRARAAIVACVFALLPVLPWTARNCRVMDSCALVSTNAGWNLAIGAFPRATGRFETLRSSDGCSEVTGQVQQDRCWLEYGIANIARAPGRWLSLVPAKLSNTFDHESFAVEYLREARPSDWWEARRVAWRSVLTAVHRIFVLASPLAFVALILPRRRGGRFSLAADAAGAPPASSDPARRSPSVPVQGGLLLALALAAYLGISAATPTFWPIVLGACVLAWLPLPGRPPTHAALLLPIVLIATTALTHAVFFGDDRYHIVVTPALCLLAAAALRAPNTRGADTEGVRAAGTSSS